MQLIQSRVKCVKAVNDTGWFRPGKGSTVIYGTEDSGVSELFQALESLNPLYDIEHRKPLADHPKEWRQGQYTKHVIPAKKTAVIMVFSAVPEQVRELADIDPALIETDRIEVGRRLDNSRWITFVEISTSSRWSEISESMHNLHNKVMKQIASSETKSRLTQSWSFLEELLPTDRLKNETADICNNWLQEAMPLMSDRDRNIARKCLFKVERSQRFITAREKTEEWLPPVLRIDREVRLRSHYPFSEIIELSDSPDPIVLLFHYFLQKVNGTGSEKREIFNKEVIRSENRLAAFTHADVKLPLIRMTENGFEIERDTKDSSAHKKIHTVLTTTHLTDVCCDRSPLLLLDKLVDDLERDEQHEIIDWLQALATENQLILSTTNREIAEMKGWKTVLHTSPEGLASSPLKAS